MNLTMPHPYSKTCLGEHCQRCFRLNQNKVQATHKVEETIPVDDPLPHRHPLTAYLCCQCFSEIMGKCQ